MQLNTRLLVNIWWNHKKYYLMQLNKQLWVILYATLGYLMQLKNKQIWTIWCNWIRDISLFDATNKKVATNKKGYLMQLNMQLRAILCNFGLLWGSVKGKAVYDDLSRSSAPMKTPIIIQIINLFLPKQFHNYLKY